MVKAKLKYVIPTFFTCFAKILNARTEGSFLLGWSDPRFTFGHGTVYKSGVAPDQHGAIPRPFCPFCRAQLSLACVFAHSPG
jgi:hypothetical protein